VSDCQFDGGDCMVAKECSVGCKESMRGNGICDRDCYFENCAWDNGDCKPCRCPPTYIGDGECDYACYNVSCRYDGGDCEL
jgi:hypothetical protein